MTFIDYFIQQQNTHSSEAHKTFTKIGVSLGHKPHINRPGRIEVIQCLLLDHNKIKLEFKNRTVAENFPKYLALNNTLLNNKQGEKKSQEKFYNILN